MLTSRDWGSFVLVPWFPGSALVSWQCANVGRPCWRFTLTVPPHSQDQFTRVATMRSGPGRMTMSGGWRTLNYLMVPFRRSTNTNTIPYNMKLPQTKHVAMCHVIDLHVLARKAYDWISHDKWPQQIIWICSWYFSNESHKATMERIGLLKLWTHWSVPTAP